MIKKLIIGVIGVFMALVMVLAIHIYQVTSEKRNQGPAFAMSKIMLNQELDSLEAIEIKQFILGKEGVKDTRINVRSGHIICLYDRNVWAPQELVDETNKAFTLNSSLYQPSQEELAASCPAIDKNSMTYKLGSFFEKLFTKL
ncbi:heavy-metal-associated domain-containing protein [Pararhodonellum marinum]|uniref:heavy-metal-associated domain-containing protein n=1 Tax=Pararhodonellum marinum TaxID=2755358 RepID=UPI00188EE8BE|nr:heavy-metal-associated domain-containing protein [Pararhodonellum marinum]